jgi:pentatricopeptide repeat protein
MRRTIRLAYIFFLLKSQAFIFKNTGRYDASFLNSVSPAVEFEVDKESGFRDTDSISQLTSFLLDDNKINPGSFSEKDLAKFFPLLLTWGKTETVEGATNVQKLLERLEKEAEAGNNLVPLDKNYYTIAVTAWGKSGHSNAANRSEMILARMEEMKKLYPSITPTRVTYNALMSNHAKNGNTKRITELLEIMENDLDLQPITNDYNMLLLAHAKLGEARQAENALKRMVDRCHEKGVDCNCQPDLISYNILLDAWSRSSEVGRGERAEAILEKLCESKDFDWEPDARTYSAAICAVIKSDEENTLERAERILAEAKSHEMDADVYLQSVLLDAYASSNSEGSARKAEELLERLEKKGFVNAVSYNTVIKAWKSSNGPNGLARAEKIVGRMKELGLVDTISYSTLIAAYAKEGNRGSAERAEAMLAEMKTMGLKPNVQTLNAGTSFY